MDEIISTLVPGDRQYVEIYILKKWTLYSCANAIKVFTVRFTFSMSNGFLM